MGNALSPAPSSRFGETIHSAPRVAGKKAMLSLFTQSHQSVVPEARHAMRRTARTTRLWETRRIRSGDGERECTRINTNRPGRFIIALFVSVSGFMIRLLRAIEFEQLLVSGGDLLFMSEVGVRDRFL